MVSGATPTPCLLVYATLLPAAAMPRHHVLSLSCGDDKLRKAAGDYRDARTFLDRPCARPHGQCLWQGQGGDLRSCNDDTMVLPATPAFANCANDSWRTNDDQVHCVVPVHEVLILALHALDIDQ